MFGVGRDAASRRGLDGSGAGHLTERLFIDAQQLSSSPLGDQRRVGKRRDDASFRGRPEGWSRHDDGLWRSMSCGRVMVFGRGQTFSVGRLRAPGSSGRRIEMEKGHRGEGRSLAFG